MFDDRDRCFGNVRLKATFGSILYLLSGKALPDIKVGPHRSSWPQHERHSTALRDAPVPAKRVCLQQKNRPEAALGRLFAWPRSRKLGDAERPFGWDAEVLQQTKHRRFGCFYFFRQNICPTCVRSIDAIVENSPGGHEDLFEAHWKPKLPCVIKPTILLSLNVKRFRFE